MELRFLKTSAVSTLVHDISSNVLRYQQNGFDDLDLFSSNYSFQSASGLFNAQELESLVIPDSHSDYEADNSYKVFNAFPNLSRYEATDPRLWTFYCHNYALDYTRARYAKKLQKEDSLGISNEIYKHFFANNNNRDLIRNNSLARLWWNYKIAQDADASNAQEMLKVLLVNTDFRASIVERTSLFSSNSFKALLQFAYKKFKNDPKDIYFSAPRGSGGLDEVNHYNYRHAAKFLNRLGGWVNLSIVEVEEIVELMSQDEMAFNNK
jgi:hypothetical protein